MSKVIITAAITGAELSKQDNPSLPCSPDEQAQAAADCVKAGASVIHIHVRDKAEKPSQDIELFREAAEKIKAAANCIVQFSTGGAVGEIIENRIRPLELKPEMASLNVGSINFGNEVFVNLPQDIEALAMKMNEYQIKPELEVYDVGMLEYGVRLVEQGLIPRPAHFQFVMGTKHGIQGSEENLKFMCAKIPKDCTFAVAGVGRYQLALAVPAAKLGGHVRCGLEDNIYFKKGVLAESNAQLVEQIANALIDNGFEIASTKEARRLLNLHA